MRTLPPLDTHAHVATDVDCLDLERLGAVTLIATRSLAEFMEVKDRQDAVSLWGVGCHPSLVRAQRDFNSKAFADALSHTAYVAEIGLDAQSRVPMARQVETFRSILDLVSSKPRIASIHTYGATELTTDLLSEYGRLDGIILHWWLGTDAETQKAVSLGNYFSVNFSMIRLSDSWKTIPLNRLLLETDHPSGDRFSSAPRQPGRVQPVERALARHHGISEIDLRTRVWSNLAAMVRATETLLLLPPAVQNMIRTLDITRSSR